MWVAVVGEAPRSGTSMLMAMLAAGGLAPVSDGEPADTVSHPSGAHQHTAVMVGDAAAVLPGLLTSRCCVKLFARQVMDLHAAGIHPDFAVFTKRPDAESVRSWERAFPLRTMHGDEAMRAEMTYWARTYLAVAGVPILDVGFHDLIDRPVEVADGINRFLGGGLDVDAMAAIPDPEHRHFGAAR